MARTELDLDHITAVCDRLAQTRVAVGLNITPALCGYAIDARSVAGARRVQAAFTRLGYRANLPERFGRKDQVTLTGWSPRGLQDRVAALRGSVAWLRDSRDYTAGNAIDHGLPSHGELRDSLRTSVEHAAGVITDHPMNVRLDDRDCAQLLQTAYQLEHEAAAHIRLHVQAADTAVHLYRQYQPGMPDYQARDIAITTATSQGPPPGWPNTTGQNRITSTARPDPNGHLTAPGRTADTTESPPGQHPAAIAAHDQPNGTSVTADRTDAPATPPPPPAPTSRPSPSNGRATR